MSDIRINFPIWAIAVFLLAYALPVTTIVLATLVFVRVSRHRRDAARGARSLALDIVIFLIGILWLIGTGGWVLFGIDQFG